MYRDLDYLRNKYSSSCCLCRKYQKSSVGLVEVRDLYYTLLLQLRTHLSEQLHQFRLILLALVLVSSNRCL